MEILSTTNNMPQEEPITEQNMRILEDIQEDKESNHE